MRRNMWNRAVYIVMIAGILGGCKAKKAVVTPSPAASVADTTPGTPSVDVLNAARVAKIEALNAKRANFSTLSGKAKASLVIGTNSNDVTMNIRIKNNEVIWVSVTALAGLEVARALITPDSVKVINRLENEYIRKPFSYLHEFTNDQVNFGTLQSVLLGNAIPEFMSDSTELNIKGTQTELSSAVGSLLYRLLSNDRDKVIQTDLSDESAGRSLIVAYDEFQTIAGQEVPHSVVLRSRVKNKNISLDLKFAKIELDMPVDIPFRVPDRFTIKN